MVSGTKKQQEDKKLILNGTPYRIRTCDLRLRRPLLYPAELQTHLSVHTEKRVMGIEPTYLAWKASVLPLNYTRISLKR